MSCVGTLEAREFVLKAGDEGNCYKHGDTGENTITIKSIADYFAEQFPQYYESGSHYREFSGPEDEKGCITQNGECPRDILADDLQPEDLKIVEAILEQIDRPNWHDIAEGAEDMFTDDQLYEPREVYGDDQAYSWKSFAQTVTTQRRFLDPVAAATIRAIFENGGPDSWSTVADPMRVIKPGELKVYRARVARNESEALEFLENPLQFLTPPPPRKAVGGRLNPPGIRVFYGATDLETCIAEVRPAVGSIVVIAKFELLRPALVFDFTAFGEEFYAPNIFDLSTGLEDLSMRNFLKELHGQITEPVQDIDGPIDYVPTQILAELFDHELGYDGIITATVQGDSDKGRNISFFQKRGFLEGDPNASVPKSADPVFNYGFEIGLLDDTNNTTGDDQSDDNEDNPLLKLSDEKPICVEIESANYEWSHTWVGEEIAF